MITRQSRQLLKFPTRLGNGSLGLFSNVNVTKIIDNSVGEKSIPMRPFVVRINVAGHPEELNVLAESSCDAIVRAMEIFFDDDGVVPPEGLSLSAHPVATLTKAA